MPYSCVMKILKHLPYLLLLAFLPWNAGFAQETRETATNRVVEMDYPASFADLMKNFEGKVVYIDILASWCVPCIAELKESKKLESFFEENDIVKLFLTIDSRDDIHKALAIIRSEGLNGYFTSNHYPGTPKPAGTYANEIYDMFLSFKDGRADITIPRYSIINKEGKLVVRDAERPSSGEKLKKQLRKYL